MAFSKRDKGSVKIKLDWGFVYDIQDCCFNLSCEMINVVCTDIYLGSMMPYVHLCNYDQ